MASNHIKEVEGIAICTICREYCTDARILTCTHYFCLGCLRDYQTTTRVKPCPMCRADTVPPARTLHNLPSDRAVNNLAETLRQRKGDDKTQPSANHQSKPTQQIQAAATSVDYTTARDTEVVSSASAADSSPARSSRHQESRHTGATSVVVHPGVKCDGCTTKTNISGTRYKCGVCQEYNLCESCERKPRGLVHDSSHIFIKLRRRRTKPVPHGQVLDSAVVAYGKSMDLSSQTHIDRIPAGVRSSVSNKTRCHRCHQSPICGIRYKCGVCDDYELCADCETGSPSFHPCGHVFLVIRHPGTVRLPFKALLKYDFYRI